MPYGIEMSLIFCRILGHLVLGWAPNNFAIEAQLAPSEKLLAYIPVNLKRTSHNFNSDLFCDSLLYMYTQGKKVLDFMQITATNIICARHLTYWVRDNSSIGFDTLGLGCFIEHIKGSQIRSSKLRLLQSLKIVFMF